MPALGKRCAECGAVFLDYSEGFVTDICGDCQAKKPAQKPRRTNKKKATPVEAEDE